ncbi:MAG: M1 family aminopeptidase, partial [Desulfobacterales bacterium]|nr:M1 family aminopeptidase [Desulfobacterales bacterium]
MMKKLIIVLLVLMPITAWSANLHYALDVQINTSKRKITGIARLKAEADKKIRLSIRNLSGLKVDGNAVTRTADENIDLLLKGGKETRISYEALFTDIETNFINKDHVFLTEEWYPQPKILVEYALSVTLPNNFIATSEAETVTIGQHGAEKTFNFHFRHPQDALHLAASTRYVLKKNLYNNIAIEAYFFKEDAHLADSYIAHTKKYLAMYETMLTPYPYRRFAIVENVFPTGNSMPTYTLLGKRVVHLPFIVNTSLGHEILHQWFGNSVYIDTIHGNWAEGIVTYLADHHYAALEGKGRAYRKQIMVDYSAYVNTNNAMPISNFFSRQNKAQKAIGYGKAAMLFHDLRKRLGDKSFFVALREFIHRNRFRTASWHDIQRSFEKVTGKKLYVYFSQWLSRKDIPQIGVESAELQVEQGKLKLNF